MIKKYISVFCVLIVISFLLSACSSSKSAINNPGSSISDTLSAEKLLEFKYQFFEANRYFLNGDYDLAISIFNSCLKIDPTSSAVHYNLASIYLIKKDANLAEVHAEKAIFYNNTNIWYLYLAGTIYSQNNKTDKAKEVFIKLIKINDAEIDYYLNLADVYIKENNFKDAIQVYNDIEVKFGISEPISLQKHKLYLASNNKKAALLTLIELSNTFPHSVEYKRMIADFYMQSGNYNDAIVTYNQVLLSFPGDGYSYIGLAECYRKMGDFNKSVDQIRMAFKSENVPSEMKLNLLVNIIQNTGDDVKIQNVSFELTELLVSQYPYDADINTIYANMLLQKNRLVGARLKLMEVVKIRKDNYAIWEQLILLDNQFQSWDTCYAHSTEALEYFPNQSFLYFFNGFSAYQLKNYEQAIKSLSFGYKLITKDDPLVSDYLSITGECYYKLNDKQKAYQYFDDILTNDNENLMVLNNYAYYLSLDSENLEKAEKMSKITVTKEPNNSTYLDTYAWVLFKLKRYKDALIYIERAVENDKSISDVVLEHYGDILFKTDNKAEALLQWIKARELGEGSGKLDIKIETQNYVE